MAWSDKEKLSFFREHLPYELYMFRQALGRMVKLHEAQDTDNVADGNAFYESFVVHARNLYHFLRNKDGGNARAMHFCSEYSPRPVGKTNGPLQKLEKPVMHMERDRPTEDGKLTILECKQLADWIEDAFVYFEKCLDEPFLAECEKWELPDRPKAEQIDVSTSTASGSSSPTSTSLTSEIGTSQIRWRGAGKPNA